VNGIRPRMWGKPFLTTIIIELMFEFYKGGARLSRRREASCPVCPIPLPPYPSPLLGASGYKETAWQSQPGDLSPPRRVSEDMGEILPYELTTKGIGGFERIAFYYESIFTNLHLPQVAHIPIGDSIRLRRSACLLTIL